MSEMVERVARAICLSRGMIPDQTLDSLAISLENRSSVREAGKPRWTYFADDARAAIEAMREPTEAMVEAGWSLSIDWGDRAPPNMEYAAMIDAALSPSAGSEGQAGG